MPMQSQAQRRYLWSQHPEVARKFEAETPDNAKLPEKARQDALKRRISRG